MKSKLILLIAEYNGICFTDKNVSNVIEHLNSGPRHILLAIKILSFCFSLSFLIFRIFGVNNKRIIQFIIRNNLSIFSLLYKLYFSLIILEHFETET